jgi:hypothetical protein
MALRLARPNRALAIVAMFLSVSAGRVAIAQTNNTEACKGLPDNVRKISAALKICFQVGSLLHGESLTSAQIQDMTNATESMNFLTPQILEQARLAEIVLENQNHNWIDKWLKISAYIIGGVSAGLGGGLRLSNDKTIQRDGTWVGIGGGVGGASVNLFDTVCFGKELDNTKKQIDLIKFPASVRDYFKVSNISDEDKYFCRHPSKLSALLTEMTAEKNALQQELKLQ